MPMIRTILQIISWLALVSLVVFPALYLAKVFETKDVMKKGMLVGTIVWFAATPLWMGRGKQDKKT